MCVRSGPFHQPSVSSTLLKTRGQLSHMQYQALSQALCTHVTPDLHNLLKGRHYHQLGNKETRWFQMVITTVKVTSRAKELRFKPRSASLQNQHSCTSRLLPWWWNVLSASRGLKDWAWGFRYAFPCLMSFLLNLIPLEGLWLTVIVLMLPVANLNAQWIRDKSKIFI